MMIMAAMAPVILQPIFTASDVPDFSGKELFNSEIPGPWMLGASDGASLSSLHTELHVIGQLFFTAGIERQHAKVHLLD